MRERPAGSGHWQLRVFAGLDPVTGKERRVSRTFHGGKRAADAELRKFIAATESMSAGTSARLSYLFAEWIRHLTVIGRKPTTLHGYEGKARAIVEGLGDPTLDKITPAMLDDFYSRCISAGLSATSVRHYHRVLGTALRQAERWGWVASPITRRAQPPTPAREEMVVPTPAEVQALLVEARDSRNPNGQAILLFAALTGMRRGELCALRWTDIDFEDSRVTVRRSIYQTTKETGETDTKTRSVRKIALDPLGVEVLRRQRDRVEAEAAMAEVEIVPNAFVFSTSADGSAYTYPDSVSQYVGRLCRRLGIPKIHLHSLRHFAASQLISAGVDVRTVAGRLGHSDPSVTLKVYSHAIEARDREAAAILGRVLPQVPALEIGIVEEEEVA
jgi:integrase